MKGIRLVSLLALLLTLSTGLMSADIEVSASLSANQIGLEDILALTITFRNVGNPPDPDLSMIEDFELVPGRMQRGTEFIMNNGGTTLLTKAIYQLRPKRLGNLTIPAITVNMDGQTYMTRPLTVVVVKGRVRPPPGPAVRRMPGFFNDPLEEMLQEPQGQDPDLFLKSHISKQQLWQGEAMVLRIELFTRDQVDEKRMLRAASVPGFWVEWLDSQTVSRSRTEPVNGKEYTVLEIDRGVFFPQRSGSLILPSFEYGFLARSANRFSFFSQHQQVIRKTETQTIEVRPLPAAAQGLAVGQLQLTLTAHSAQVDVNDLLTLTMTVKGTGNAKAIQLPDLPVLPGFKPFEAKITRNSRIEEENVLCEVIGEIPVALKRVGKLEIPAIVYRFFNPQTAQIEESVSQVLTINVTGSPEKRESGLVIGGESVKRTGADIDYILDGPINDPRNSWAFAAFFPWLVFIPFALPLFMVFKRFVYEPMQAKNPAKNQKGRLLLLRKRMAQVNRIEDLASILDVFLAEALSIRPAELSRGKIEEAMRAFSLAESDVCRLLDFRDELEGIRFAGAVSRRAKLSEQRDWLLEILSRLKRKST